MYALVEILGKQYKAEPGRFIDIEKLDGQSGDAVSFSAMMVVDGEDVRIGKPFVEGVTVNGKIIKQDKAKKVVVYKYKSKKNYHKKQGHRQPYTRVEIVSID